MNPEETRQARHLVRETFTQSFDKGRFHHFVQELLNDFDESKAAPMAVPDAFAPHVRSCTRLGTYESPDGELADVLIVNATEPWKLERSRTALRDFVAHKLKRGDNYKEAGLVAFVAPDARAWRFSFVRMEYESKRDLKTGKIAVEERLTPARRFSYIVGENESCHTAQSRFLDLLGETDSKPTLAQIESAFSVEIVTREFFGQYKTLVLDFKDELDHLARRDKTIGAEFSARKVSTADFAKKLLGQIVFLYFLQKKGWLGVRKGADWGEGPHNFLRQLYEGKFCAHKNFFNDILEPLFYDTLATDRGHDALCKIFHCRIPFLNGGLFEPLAGYDWQKTDIVIPDKLFSNTKRNDQGDIGTGVLDVFDRYNFTVNEAEPLEKEVAIDPEMLGKVFENLLEVKERKSKGSFYTPREIVHYMCQESLINYLDTALNSRAEPIGKEKRKQAMFGDEKAEQVLLTAAVRKEVIHRADIETFIHSGDQASHYEAARVEGTSGKRKLPKTIETHARLLDDKLADIAVCDPAIGSGAFPVGMMQEIVRARSALTPYFNDVHERTSYHFKRHSIQNCIYGVDIDPGAVEIAKLRLWLSLVVDEDDVKQIKPLPNLDYKVVVGNSLLGVEKNLFNAELFKRLEELKPRYFDATDRKQKEKFKHEIDDLIHELTNSKEAFDFEIYFSEVFHTKKGFDAVIGNPPWGADLTESESRALSERFSHVPSKTKDSYFFFICQSIEVLKTSGSLSLIIPNTWLLINAAKDFRKHILSFDLKQIIEHGDGVFEQATVESSTLILVKDKSNGACRAVRFRKGGMVIDHDLDKNIWLQDDFARINVNLDAADAALLAKLRQKGEPFEKDCVIIWGIKPYQVGYGIPPQTREMVEKRIYHATTKRGQDWKPLLVGGNVNRYSLQFPGDLFIKYGKWLMYPSNERLMLGPKILMRQTSDTLRCCYDDGGYYCQNSVFIVHSASLELKYLMALLNSKLLGFVYKCGNPQMGKVFAEIKPSVIKALPIRRINRTDATDKSRQEKTIKLVERILSAKQRDAGADVSALECELDEVVFALYALTPEEIAIVEGTGR